MESGILFTNENHLITYIDTKLQSISGGDTNGLRNLIGSPVYDLFKMSRNDYHRFIAKYIFVPSPPEIPVDLQVSEEKSVPVIISGVAKKDKEGKLSGIDYRIKAIPDASPAIDEETVRELKNFYLSQQLEGFYTIAVKWGGEQLEKHLKNIINTTASDNNWSIEIQAGKVHIRADLPDEAYQILLIKTASYLRTMLGRSLIHQQVQAVNDKSDDAIFEYINRDWYQSL